ncbi:MAG TPA: molybdopterin cofactor-binding domain-containing protein, partial [Gemmatimonadales bacterium]|nr:molybdopterin cofactor-binding domain-containing protein [Gemmatimonadales bacterium]
MPQVTYKAGGEGIERELTVEIHEQDAPPWGADATLRLVGGAHPRPDGALKATGQARYTQDVTQPRMAYAGALLAPYGHATLRQADEAAARAVKGVLEVRVERREIKHAGQPVAWVCAESERALKDGLRALAPVYEVLPAAVTTEDAMREGAPEVEPGKGNVVIDGQRGRQGNPEAFEKAYADSPIKVEAEFRTQVQTHSALEPHGSLSVPGPAGDAVVYASTQATSAFQGLGRALGLDGPVRVIADHVGGGFGAKFGPLPGDQAAAGFANKLQRPVKYMCTRREEHLVGGMRPDSIQRLKLGGTKDGQVLA